MENIPPDFCATFWNQAMSRSGMDAKGQPIRSFRHALAAAWSYEQNRRQEQKARGKANGPPPRDIRTMTDEQRLAEARR